MDNRRFDEMTKRLSGGGSRRAMLRKAAGGVLAAAFGLGAADASARACRERQRRCDSANQCCGGKSACRRVTKLDYQLAGTRCCGTQGAMCDVTLDGCDCCGDLVCNPLDQRCSLPDLPTT